MIKKIIYLIVFTGIISSCTERIELELDDTYTRLVVFAELTDESKPHMVKLTKTGSYLTDKPDIAVAGAKVSIESSGEVFPLYESDEPGVYYTDSSVEGVPGNSYTLHIELPEEIDGQKVYTASSFMYQAPPLDSIGIRYHVNWKIYEIQCYATDPITTDFYMFDIYKNSLMMTDTLYEKIVVDDAFYNGQYTNGIGVGWLDAEDPQEALFTGDTVTLRMARITEEYADYIWRAQSELYHNPLFGGPPANVNGNISNGAIGFFAVYSVMYSSVIFEN